MTEATLQLDARQRAMLDEMGVKVWWPTAERTLSRTSASAAPEPTATMEPAATTKAAATVAAAEAPALRRAQGAALAASVLIEPAIRLYDGSGPPEGGWLLVVDTPPSADGRHDDEPFAGDAGRLLQNMLRALQLDRGSAPVHLARVHRGAAGAPAGDGTALGTGFAAHASALAPRLVLALGPLSAQGLMQSDEPLGKLRGRIARVAAGPGGMDMPLVASYHPVYLLRNAADKAKAWAAVRRPRP
jgi:uracil-DNA glycosylase family 4